MAKKRVEYPEMPTERPRGAAPPPPPTPSKKIPEAAPIEINGLPNKALLRIDEVAAYFDIARSTVYLWIDHGILIAEKYHGTVRVPRESILKCRLANRLNPME